MAEVITYKGNDVLVLNPGERFPFSFGRSKAQMIVDNIDIVKAFAAGEDIDGVTGDAIDEMQDEYNEQEMPRGY